MRKHIVVMSFLLLLTISTLAAQDKIKASQFWPLKEETNRWVYYFPSNSVNILYPEQAFDSNLVYITLVPYYELSSINPFHINIPPFQGKPLIHIGDYHFELIMLMDYRTIANFAIAAGDSFYTNDPIDLYVKCISRDTTVTVMAGTFEHCMAFDNGAIWAQGIGPVNELSHCRVDGKEYFPSLVPESAKEYNLGPPDKIEVMSNFPNPFNSQTEIQFKTTAIVDLKIYVTNILGRRIKELSSSRFAPGIYYEHWNGTDDFGKSVPSGAYFIHLQAGAQHETIKTLVAR